MQENEMLIDYYEKIAGLNFYIELLLRHDDDNSRLVYEFKATQTKGRTLKIDNPIIFYTPACLFNEATFIYESKKHLRQLIERIKNITNGRGNK